jgi:hypothetical protein
MRTRLGVSMFAVLLAAITFDTASAAYFGVASYKNCGGEDPATYCCDPCHTVMRTRRRIVFEQQQFTRYKTVYNTVYEDKTINTVKYVPETHYRECTYEVCQAGL